MTNRYRAGWNREVEAASIASVGPSDAAATYTPELARAEATGSA